MSPSATPVTQSDAASRAMNGDQARRQIQPSALSAACHAKGMRTPRKWKVDVAKCHACYTHGACMPPTPSGAASRATNGQCHKCHPNWRGRPMGTKRTTRSSAISGTPATHKARGCGQVPRMPREGKVDVAKRHACHTSCVRKIVCDKIVSVCEPL